MKFVFLSSHAHLALDRESAAVSGGAELQVALLAAELAARGHEVVIIGGDTGQADGRILRGVRTRVGGKFHTGGVLDTLRALPVVLRILAEEKPDYTLIRGWTTWLFFLQLAQRALKTRVVFMCGLDTEVNGVFARAHPLRGAVFTHAVRQADVRFAMTDYQREQFHRAGLACGMYRNLILPRATPRTAAKDIDFLWVARGHPIKRPHVFLDLAERLPAARCVMICPPEDAALWEALESRARNLPNVQFLPRVPYHESQGWYDRAAVFVNTSEAEGFPNTFIQAALGGAAILSLAVDPDGMLTRHGAGLCAGGNREKFFAGAAQLLGDAEAREKLGGQAARFVAELHDTGKNVDAFLAGLGPAGQLPAPRRVLHVIDSSDLGGAQVVVRDLVKFTDRTRFAPEVACLHGRGVFWPSFAALGVPVHSLSPAKWLPLYTPRLAWLTLARRYAVVHCHLLAANVLAKPLAALLGVPVRINHDHCNDKLADARGWAPAADRWANRFSTHICAVSESTRRFLVTAEGVPEERATTVRNGIDLANFRPRPEQRAAARKRWELSEDAFVIAGIGRLTYQKNFALFLETAAGVLARHPRAFFVLAGTGGEESALRAQAAQLGIAERVRFLGYVGEMTALYPALDMLLLTSRYEGLPITILEAMAVGVPIVASRLDGVEEVLRDGEDAALVPAGSRDGFVARVGELIEQPALARRYADAALVKVRAHYSAEAMTRAVEAIYLKYLAPHG